MAGTCGRCSRPYRPDPLSRERVEDFFGWLKEMLAASGRIEGPPLSSPTFDWFRDEAHRRLRMGAETYGNENFLKPHINLPSEAIEELLDVANYGLMELVKNDPDDVDAVPLGQAIYHAFCAYQSLLQYRYKRSSIPT